MLDPDKNVVDMVTDVLRGYQESGKDSPLLIGYINRNKDVEIFAYLNCNYSDLRRLATAVNDEAQLRMIAVNQDRIDKFAAENEVDNA